MLLATRSLLCLFALAATATCQIPVLSGLVFDGPAGGGPLIQPVYIVGADIDVPAGETLTVAAGTTLKFKTNTQMRIFGTLLLQGTASSQVFLTSFADDSVGGDTNTNGVSVGAPGDWRGLIFLGASDASCLEHSVIRFGGENGTRQIELMSADIEMTACVVAHCKSGGLDVGTSAPLVTGCTFDNCHLPVIDVPLASVPGFSNNNAVNNALGNSMHIMGAAGPSTSVTTDNMIGGAFSTRTLTVPLGSSLTIGAGVVLKFALDLSLEVDGDLTIAGTTNDPVVMTARLDDAIGGDTPNDGPTVGTPGLWRGLLFRAGATAAIEHLLVRFAGRSNRPAINLVGGPSFTMRHSAVEFANNTALAAGLSRPVIEHCRFDGNVRSLSGIPWDGLPHLRHNTATGNTVRDALLVANAVITGDVEVHPYNYPGDALLGYVDVTGGHTLTLGAGVAIKVTADRRVSCSNGALLTRGTAQRPVVFTSALDDAIGGDTNLDGTLTVPQPGNWRSLGISTGASAPPSRLEHTVIRYAGRNAGVPTSSLVLSSPVASARSIRVELCASTGVYLGDLAGDVENAVITNNGGIGIRAVGNTADIVHATITGNGGVGVSGASNWTGTVINSIVRNNTGGEIVGVPVTRILGCDADASFAGQNGNIDADPLFVDAPTGDLRLTAASPCVDTADVTASAMLATDHVEASRRSDATLSGQTPLPDMGAFERTAFQLEATGVARLGSTIVYEVTGPPGIAILFLDLEKEESLFFDPFGHLLLTANPATLVEAAILPTGTPLMVQLNGPPVLEGFRFALQALAFPSGTVAAGNFTNRTRHRLFD